MQEFPVLLHVLTGEVMCHADVNGGKPFVVDLSSLAFSEDAKLDYDHETGAIECVIGTCTNFRVEEDGLFADGEILQDDENDPVRLLLAKIRSKKIKYGCSPRLALGPFEDIPKGHKAVVNGLERIGPIRHYKNAVVKGVAVSPYPTDEGTNVTLLSASNIVLLASNHSILQEKTSMADEPKEVPDTPEPKKLKDPDLAEFCEVFGPQKGMDLYQDGADIQEVRTLKDLLEKYGVPGAANAAAELSDKPTEEETPVQTSESDPPKDEEEPKKTAELSAKTIQSLESKIVSLEKQVVNLSAKFTANLTDKGGVNFNHSDPTPPKPKEGYDRADELERLKRLSN